nr:MAG TPA: hypothetical protein [Caudoviricetes sp.]
MVLHCPFTNVVLRCNFTEGHHPGPVSRFDSLPVRFAHSLLRYFRFDGRHTVKSLKFFQRIGDNDSSD